MDIGCIENELKLIINRKKNVSSSKIIIYAFALIELIDKIKETHSIPNNFIKYIEIIKNDINCNIDINFLKVIKNNEDTIIAIFSKSCNNKDLKDSKYSLSSSSSISSSYSSNSTYSSHSSSSSSVIDQSIDKKIQKMLKEDAEKIEKIINMDDNNENDNDDNELIRKAKILFDKFDKENDGILSAEDIIKIIEFNEKYPLVFPSNVEDTFAYLLIVNFFSNEKITFRQFLEHFL